MAGCTEESGTVPSLGCAVQEEDGYSKGERWEVFGYLLSPLSGHLCPVTEVKGNKRLCHQKQRS